SPVSNVLSDTGLNICPGYPITQTVLPTCNCGESDIVRKFFSSPIRFKSASSNLNVHISNVSSLSIILDSKSQNICEPIHNHMFGSFLSFSKKPSTQCAQVTANVSLPRTKNVVPFDTVLLPIS